MCWNGAMTGMMMITMGIAQEKIHKAQARQKLLQTIVCVVAVVGAMKRSSAVWRNVLASNKKSVGPIMDLDSAFNRSD